MKIVAIVSGGMDSTTLYFHLKAEGHEVYPVNFSYGSKHNSQEREAFLRLMGQENIPFKLVDLDLSFLHSSLLTGGDAIPHGHYAADNMKSTIVPFRNGIMLAYATAIAEDIGADAIALGNHAGDHTIYPDCRPEFVRGFSEASQAGTWKHIPVIAPFTHLRKENLVERAAELGVLPQLANSYSCYEGGPIHCGKCGTCVERKEAFLRAGDLDPTIYLQQGE